MNMASISIVDLDINVAALVLLIGVLVMSLRAFNKKNFRGKLFVNIVILMLINAAVNIAVLFLTADTSGRVPDSLIMVLLTAVEISYTMVMVEWLFYAMYDTFKSEEYLKRKRWLVLGPGLVLVVIAVINLFVPILFTYDHVNGYQSRIFYLVYNIPRHLYIIISVVQNTRYRLREKSAGALNIWLFVIPLVLSTIVETITGYSITALGCAIGFTSIYIVMTSEMCYTDFESGFFNPNYLSPLYNRTEAGSYLPSSIITFKLKEGEDVEAFSNTIRTVLPDECDTIRTDTNSFITVSESKDRGYVFMLSEDLSMIAEDAGFDVEVDSVVRGKDEPPEDFLIDNVVFKRG